MWDEKCIDETCACQIFINVTWGPGCVEPACTSTATLMNMFKPNLLNQLYMFKPWCFNGVWGPESIDERYEICKFSSTVFATQGSLLRGQFLNWPFEILGCDANWLALVGCGVQHHCRTLLAKLRLSKKCSKFIAFNFSQFIQHSLQHVKWFLWTLTSAWPCRHQLARRAVRRTSHCAGVASGQENRLGSLESPGWEVSINTKMMAVKPSQNPWLGSRVKKMSVKP